MSSSRNGEVDKAILEAQRQLEMKRRAVRSEYESRDRTQDTHDTRETQTPNDSQRHSKKTSTRLSPQKFNRETAKSVVLHEWETKKQFSQPLNAHIIGAVGAHHELSDEYHSKMWFFTFLVRSHPDLVDTCDDDALDIVTEAFMKTLTSTHDSDKAWEMMLNMPAIDAQTEFLDLWNRIDYRHGDNPVAHANRKAKEQPDTELPDIRKFRTLPKYREFILTTAWMQVILGPTDIALPDRLTGNVIDTCPDTICRYIGWATGRNKVHDEVFLVKTRDHVYGWVDRDGERKWEQQAAEYVFNLELVPELLEVFIKKHGEPARWKLSEAFTEEKDENT